MEGFVKGAAFEIARDRGGASSRAQSLQPVLGRCSGQILAAIFLALGLIRPVAASAAETEVKLSQAQIQSLGVRVAHPISSRTDQTLAFPAQIVIPTPQLWVVSAPIAAWSATSPLRAATR